MAGEQFKFMTGIDMAHVAYRSSAPALTDLLGGPLRAYFRIDQVYQGRQASVGQEPNSTVPDVHHYNFYRSENGCPIAGYPKGGISQKI